MNASPPFVLVVEDCFEAVPALQIAIESFFGCSVRHVPDAEHALALMDVDLAAPLALITDLNLPQIDGYELIQRIRRGRWAELPVIVISAETNRQAPDRVRELGADGFFAKPYSPMGICVSLEKIIHAKSKSAVPSHDSGDSIRPESG